jgi:hypothetical protein
MWGLFKDEIMAIIVGENSYITEAEADAYFAGLVDGAPWAGETPETKEKNILTSFHAIEEKSYESEEAAKRDQLRTLNLVYLHYDEWKPRHVLNLAGVKRTKNSKFEEEYFTDKDKDKKDPNAGLYENEMVDLC